MKKYLIFTSVIALMLFISCSNDFEVNAPWKDIPIVYGLLDVNDSAHYIRVEKAYLTNDEDALEIAKIVDSIYYENVIVQLKRGNDLFTLTKVDGNLWGFPREEGVFATSPNWLYRIDSTELLLKPNDSIFLQIDRGNGLPLVTSKTFTLAPLKLNTPQASSSGFGFNTLSKTSIVWEAPDAANIFDATLYFKYVEFPAANPTAQVEKTIIWPWARGLRRENSNKFFEVEKEGKEFFDLLKNNIPVDDNLKRIFRGIDVEIIAGDDALQSYVNVALANSGITASQDIPTFSNISEGRGVFSSINSFHRYAVGLTDKARDSLKMGYLTKNLNF